MLTTVRNNITLVVVGLLLGLLCAMLGGFTSFHTLGGGMENPAPETKTLLTLDGEIGTITSRYTFIEVDDVRMSDPDLMVYTPTPQPLVGKKLKIYITEAQ